MALVRAQARQSGYHEIVGPGEKGLRYLSFGLLSLGEGERWEGEFADREALLVVLAGRCDVQAGKQRWQEVGERESVFAGKPAAVYAPPGCQISVVGRGEVEIAVCGALAETGPEPTLITPQQVGLRVVGEGTCERQIHDLVTRESFPARRLLAGETYNRPGLWSSYPPHKHDRHQPPHEHALEEVYHFRVDPPHGFGLHRVYGETVEDCYAVHDRDTAVITQGYHPVVAAPGYRLYYLWMLAGETRDLVWSEDPAHRSVRNRQ